MADHTPIIQYKWEYNNFLEFVKAHKLEHAILYAKALKIDRRTLANWMNQPELREALMETLDELTAGMKRAGSKDWRMWREYMKILGIDDESKLDITSDGERLPTVIIGEQYAATPNFRVDNSSSEVDDMAGQSSTESS